MSRDVEGEKKEDVPSTKSPADGSAQSADSRLKKSPSSELSDLFNQGKINFEKDGDAIGEGGDGRVFSAKAVSSSDVEGIASTSPLVLKTIKNSQKEAEDLLSSPSSEFLIHAKLTENSSSHDAGILKLISQSGVMIRCDGVLSSLCKFLRSEEVRKTIFFNYFVMNFIESMIKALTTLHHEKVVHADIKPGNVGIRFHADGDIYFALFDLGSAKTYKQIEEGEVLNGTPGYGAPESWDRDPKIVAQNKEKIDIYAIGRTLHSFFETVGSGLFSLGKVTEQYDAEKEKNRLVDHAERLQLISSTADFSKKLQQVIEGMCEQLPKNRLSLNDCAIIAKQLRNALPTLPLEKQSDLYRWYRQLVDGTLPIAKAGFFSPKTASFAPGDSALLSGSALLPLANNKVEPLAKKNGEEGSSAENTPLLPRGK